MQISKAYCQISHPEGGLLLLVNEWRFKEHLENEGLEGVNDIKLMSCQTLQESHPTKLLLYKGGTQHQQKLLL